MKAKQILKAGIIETFFYKGKEIYMQNRDFKNNTKGDKIVFDEEYVKSNAGIFSIYYPKALEGNLTEIMKQATKKQTEGEKMEEGQTIIDEQGENSTEEAVTVEEEKKEEQEIVVEEKLEETVIEEQENSEEVVSEVEFIEDQSFTFSDEDRKKLILEYYAKMQFDSDYQKNNEIAKNLNVHINAYNKKQSEIKKLQENDQVLEKFNYIMSFRDIHNQNFKEQYQYSIYQVVAKANVVSDIDLQILKVRLDGYVAIWNQAKVDAFNSMEEIDKILNLNENDNLEEKLQEYLQKNISKEVDETEREVQKPEEKKRGRKVKKGKVKAKNVVLGIGITAIVVAVLGTKAYFTYRHCILPYKIKNKAETKMEEATSLDINDISFSDSVNNKFYLFALTKNEDENKNVSFQVCSIEAGDIEENNESYFNNKLSWRTTKEQKKILDDLDSNEVILGDNILITGSAISKTPIEDKDYYVVQTAEESSKTFIIGNGKIYTGTVSEDTTIECGELVCSCKTTEIEECLANEIERQKEEAIENAIAEKQKVLDDMATRLIDLEIFEEGQEIDSIVEIEGNKFCKFGDDKLVVVNYSADNFEVIGCYVLGDSYVSGFSEKIATTVGESAKDSKAYVSSSYSNNDGEYTMALDMLLLNADETGAMLYDDIYKVESNKLFKTKKMTECFYNEISGKVNTEVGTYIYNQSMLEK